MLSVERGRKEGKFLIRKIVLKQKTSAHQDISHLMVNSWGKQYTVVTSFRKKIIKSVLKTSTVSQLYNIYVAIGIFFLQSTQSVVCVLRMLGLKPVNLECRGPTP